MALYPLRFTPILKQKIWGGNKLKEEFNKSSAHAGVGESWELSCVKDNVSIISEGAFKGRDLQSVIKEYGPRILGQKVFDKTGYDFPLLFKFIDAAGNLSVQVHPGDDLAQKRHNSFGKTEMWYILCAEEDSILYSGLKKQITKEEYPALVESGAFISALAAHPVKAGDAFFIPAGRVHAIGAGIVLAEIQQTSDITYRIYDYNRLDDSGKPRELHTQLAQDAIDFTVEKDYKINYTPRTNAAVQIESCPFFTVNLIALNSAVERDLKDKGSFVVYMCVEGIATIKTENGATPLKKGDTILLPAEIAACTLTSPGAKLLEIYV